MTTDPEQVYQIKYTVDGKEESDIFSAATAGKAIDKLKAARTYTNVMSQSAPGSYPPISIRILSIKEYSTKEAPH